MLLWTTLCDVLPTSLAVPLGATVPRVIDRVHEVRLRVGEAVVLTTADGQVSTNVVVPPDAVHECFLRCCSHAVHAHQEELRHGFVTTASGIRVGVAGAAVVKDGAVVSCRDITSLCLRLPRALHGCAAPLLPFVADGERLKSVLLCGPPASGKTTLLRDLAVTLGTTHAVSVVDERHELSAGGCRGCDVLCGYPKEDGILQAVRTLAPEAIIIDELGAPAEWDAVLRGCYCGVAVIASAHIAGLRDVRARRGLMAALADGAFARLIFLPPRGATYGDSVIVEAGDILENTGRVTARVRLRGIRHQGGMELAL